MATSTKKSATAQGIVIAPHTIAAAAESPASDDFCCKIGAATATSSFFDTLPWATSEISALLGLPVKVAPWPSAQNRQPNNIALGLFIHINPEQDNFGKVRFRSVDGAVIVARIDGKELGEKEVEMLLTYIGEMSHEITTLVSEDHGDRVGKAKEFVGSRWTAEAFGQFVEGRQTEQGSQFSERL
ncbi:hypothetical protein LTR85_011502 [Meristemomyces frigidus]|nr:hypothetical protein LTR85_011502 [Meristemomyces frigidus]